MILIEGVVEGVVESEVEGVVEDVYAPENAVEALRKFSSDRGTDGKTEGRIDRPTRRRIGRPIDGWKRPTDTKGLLTDGWEDQQTEHSLFVYNEKRNKKDNNDTISAE